MSGGYSTGAGNGGSGNSGNREDVRSALPYAQQLDINVPLITYQGALVKNSGSGETLYYRPLPGEYTLPLLERVREVGYHCQLYLDDELYMEKLTAEGKQYASVAGVKPVIVDSLDGVLKKETTKMVIIHFDTGSGRVGKTTAG